MKQFVYAVVFSLTFAPALPSLEAHASDSRLERKEDRLRDKIKDNQKEITELRKQISQVAIDLARCRAEVQKLRGRGGYIKPAPKTEDTGEWGDTKGGKGNKDKFEWGGKGSGEDDDEKGNDELANKEAYCESLQARLDGLKQEERNYKEGIDQYKDDIDKLYERESREDCVDCAAKKAAPNTGKSGWEVFADVLKAATPLGLGGMNTWLGYKGMKMGQQDYQLYANSMMAQGLPIQPNSNSYGGILGSVTGANAMLSMFMNGWGSGAGNMFGGPFMGGGINLGMGGGFYPGMGMGMYGMGGGFAIGNAFVSGFAAGGGFSPYGMGGFSMGMGYAPYGMGGGFAIGNAFVGGFAAGGGFAPYGMGGGFAPYGMGMGYAPYGMAAGMTPMGMGYAPYGMGGSFNMGMGYSPYGMGAGMAPMGMGMGQSFNGFVPYNMGGAYAGSFAPYSMGMGGGYAPYSGGYMAYAAGAPYGQSFVGGSGFGPVPGTYPGYPGGYPGGFPGGNPGAFPYANPMYGMNPSCYGGMCSYNPYMSGINGQYNAGGLPNFYMNQQQQLSAQMRAYQQQNLLGQDAQVAQQAMQEAQARYQYVTGQMTGSNYSGGTIGYGGAGYTTPYYSAGYYGGNNTTVPALTGTRQ